MPTSRDKCYREWPWLRQRQDSVTPTSVKTTIKSSKVNLTLIFSFHAFMVTSVFDQFNSLSSEANWLEFFSQCLGKPKPVLSSYGNGLNLCSIETVIFFPPIFAKTQGNLNSRVFFTSISPN